VIDLFVGESVLAAGVVSGAELKMALIPAEPIPPFARAVRKAFRPPLVVAGLFREAFGDCEADEASGITTAETIPSEHVARMNSIRNDRFELTKEKPECSLFRRRYMMSSPIIRLRAALASRDKYGFQ